MANQDDYMKTALRLPRDLHTKLMESAEVTGKSLNAEMIARLTESFAGTKSPNMVAALARLTLSLSMKDAEKITEQMQAAIFARQARLFGERLLPLVEKSDPEFATEIKIALQEANEYFHKRQDFDGQMAKVAASAQQAMTHIERLAGVESNPELEQLLNEVQQLAPSDKSDDADSAEQKTRQPRNTRKATKKKPE